LGMVHITTTYNLSLTLIFPRPEQKGQLKTNTVLQYDNEWKVSKWGNPALAERPKKKKLFAQSEARPVELFKLHLGNMANDKKPRLPKGLDYRKAIKDYLKKLNEVGNDHTLLMSWRLCVTIRKKCVRFICFPNSQMMDKSDELYD